MSKVYGIISIKGGVGKTTAVSNLGAALAHSFDKKVLLVDANFSAPNLGLHLGVVDTDHTIHDVLAGKQKIENVIQESDHGFDFVPGSLTHKGKLNYLQLKRHLDTVKDNYDVVLIDSSPNLNNEILATMMASDELLVVATPDYPTLSCTMHAVKIAKTRKTPILGLILNRVYDKKFELTLEEIEESAETPVIAILPHEINLLESVSETTPGTLHSPVTKAAIEYKNLAGVLVGERFKEKRITARIKNLFRSKRKHEENREAFFEEEEE